MFPSMLAVSAAILSLSSFSQAIPQEFTSSVFIPTPSVSSSFGAPTQAASPSSSTACNNSPELCNRNYNNITHMGSHNAAFLRDKSTSFSTSGNQFYNATVSLDAGIRLLQIQAHNINGTVRLCHSSCTLLDAGPLANFLSDVNKWMNKNPNEVVTLIVVNANDMTASQLGSAFTSSGISKHGYVPATLGATSTWPTLQTLISAGTRLVTFIASIEYSTAHPYLLPEFDYVFETAFGVTSQDGFNCTLDRPSTQSSTTAAISSGFLGLVNHFLDIEQSFFQVPDVDNLATTNSAVSGTRGSLATQAERCQREWGAKPTFILVNFFNVGPAIKIADRLNGITAVGRQSVSTEVLAASSAGTRSGAVSSSLLAVVGLTAVAVGNLLWF